MDAGKPIEDAGKPIEDAGKPIDIAEISFEKARSLQKIQNALRGLRAISSEVPLHRVGPA